MKKYAIGAGIILLMAACAAKKKVEIKPVEGLEEITIYQETTGIVVPAETLAVPVLPPPGTVIEETPIVVPPVLPVEPVVNIVPAETTVTYTPPTPVVPITPATPPALPPSTYGFRVQIFASSSRENAERIANNAKATFSQGLYVEAEDNLFKVRIGDFITREDATQLKAKAAQLGFRGAFVVETMVIPK